MPPPYYRPVKKNRFFARHTRYSEIDWNNSNTVIKEFRKRIRVWYIKPVKKLQQTSGDYSFPVAGLTCLLIDMLSQYFPQTPHPPGPGIPGWDFKEFIRQHLPDYSGPLPVTIRHYRHDTGAVRNLTTLEDVIYHALRCGILHEAHITLYAGIYGLSGKRYKYYKAKCTKYGNGGKCLTVAVDPHRLFADTLAVFEKYIRHLNNPKPRYDPLRAAFKAKFLKAFGIDIGNEPT